jgi:hypothetical protein
MLTGYQVDQIDISLQNDCFHALLLMKDLFDFTPELFLKIMTKLANPSDLLLFTKLYGSFINSYGAVVVSIPKFWSFYTKYLDSPVLNTCHAAAIDDLTHLNGFLESIFGSMNSKDLPSLSKLAIKTFKSILHSNDLSDNHIVLVAHWITVMARYFASNRTISSLLDDYFYQCSAGLDHGYLMTFLWVYAAKKVSRK